MSRVSVSSAQEPLLAWWTLPPQLSESQSIMVITSLRSESGEVLHTALASLAWHPGTYLHTYRSCVLHMSG